MGRARSWLGSWLRGWLRSWLGSVWFRAMKVSVFISFFECDERVRRGVGRGVDRSGYGRGWRS